MTLKEWNHLVCEAEREVAKYYLDIKVKSYATSNGGRGFTFQLFDCNGNFFKEYKSGTLEDDYKCALKQVKTAAMYAIKEVE